MPSMPWSAPRWLRTALHRTGLLDVARHGRDWWWAREFAHANREFLETWSDGLPVPPTPLRILVAASPDIAWFIDSGRRGADSIRAVLERHAIPLDRSTPLLDFGCGCGRITRHFAWLGPAVHGTDLNPSLVAWCRRHLTFGHFDVNGLGPPLPFTDGQFALAYALSVFTHLPETLQMDWMEELRRVVRPGGHVVITTHGVRYLDELSDADRVRFASGELVIRRDDRPGSNVCGAYHPERYVREHLARGLTVVEFVAEGAAGNPHQDLWLLRRN
jgi:SAM-dependent methyltransferase